jgi:hypothetical protein
VTQLDRLFLFGAKIWAQRQVAQQSEDMRFATAADNTADCFFCPLHNGRRHWHTISTADPSLGVLDLPDPNSNLR